MKKTQDRKVYLDKDTYTSLYSALAERRLWALEEWWKEKHNPLSSSPTEKEYRRMFAQGEFIQECSVIEDILIKHGIYNKYWKRFHKQAEMKNE